MVAITRVRMLFGGKFGYGQSSISQLYISQPLRCLRRSNEYIYVNMLSKHVLSLHPL